MCRACKADGRQDTWHRECGRVRHPRRHPPARRTPRVFLRDGQRLTERTDQFVQCTHSPGSQSAQTDLCNAPTLPFACIVVASSWARELCAVHR